MMQKKELNINFSLKKHDKVIIVHSLSNSFIFIIH